MEKLRGTLQLRTVPRNSDLRLVIVEGNYVDCLEVWLRRKGLIGKKVDLWGKINAKPKSEVARAYGLGQESVNKDEYWVLRETLTIRRKLQKLYWQDRLSLREIAKIYGISAGSMSRIFNELGIVRRDHSQAASVRWGPTQISGRAVALLKSDPSLTLTDVAKEVGRSRERIRQIADDIPGASRHRKGVCCVVCGVEIKRGEYGYRYRHCPQHGRELMDAKKRLHWSEFTCESCGAKFSRRLSQVKRAIKEGCRIRFCSRQCQGKWLGTNHRRGRQKAEFCFCKIRDLI